jgi:hypothetical protein
VPTVTVGDTAHLPDGRGITAIGIDDETGDEDAVRARRR